MSSCNRLVVVLKPVIFADCTDGRSERHCGWRICIHPHLLLSLDKKSSYLHLMTAKSIISVTTTTANSTLLRYKLTINLFSLAHYLDEYGNSEFPEIGKITMNFGRQRNPTTQKRIFFTAIWFKLSHKDHNLCLKFWSNGSLHVTGMLDHVTESVWLSHWVANLFEHIESTPVRCLLMENPAYCGLKTCDHNIVWSKAGNYPIGWTPSEILPAEHRNIGLHGKPVKPIYDGNGHIHSFSTTKGKKEIFDANGDTPGAVLCCPVPTLAMTNRPGEKYSATFGQDMRWSVSCINAKCEKSREPHRKRWLSREHFTHYMQRVYRTVQTTFDPMVYKAVQLTFFDKCSDKDKAAAHIGPLRRTKRQNIGQKVGTVSMTSTGLFWLYGFKDLDRAKERAEHMVTLLKQYKSYLRSHPIY